MSYTKEDVIAYGVALLKREKVQASLNGPDLEYPTSDEGKAGLVFTETFEKTEEVAEVPVEVAPEPAAEPEVAEPKSAGDSN